MSLNVKSRSITARVGVAGKGFCKHKSERCDTSVSPSHRMDRHPADLSPETIHSGSRSSPDSGPFSKCLSSPVSSFSQQVTTSPNPYKPPRVTHVAVQFVLSCFDLSLSLLCSLSSVALALLTDFTITVSSALHFDRLHYQKVLVEL